MFEPKVVPKGVTRLNLSWRTVLVVIVFTSHHFTSHHVREVEVSYQAPLDYVSGNQGLHFEPDQGNNYGWGFGIPPLSGGFSPMGFMDTSLSTPFTPCFPHLSFLFLLRPPPPRPASTSSSEPDVRPGFHELMLTVLALVAGLVFVARHSTFSPGQRLGLALAGCFAAALSSLVITRLFWFWPQTGRRPPPGRQGNLPGVHIRHYLYGGWPQFCLVLLAAGACFTAYFTPGVGLHAYLAHHHLALAGPRLFTLALAVLLSFFALRRLFFRMVFNFGQLLALFADLVGATCFFWAAFNIPSGQVSFFWVGLLCLVAQNTPLLDAFNRRRCLSNLSGLTLVSSALYAALWGVALLAALATTHPLVLSDPRPLPSSLLVALAALFVLPLFDPDRIKFFARLAFSTLALVATVVLAVVLPPSLHAWLLVVGVYALFWVCYVLELFAAFRAFPRS